MTNVAWDEDDVLDRTSMGVKDEPAEAPAAEAEAAEALPTEVVELRRWQAALVAVGSLIFIYGIAVASMYAIGSVLHAIDPGRRFDILYVLHNRIVLLVLIGVTVLWLLPPYPSAIRELKRRPDDRLRSAGTDTGDGEPEVTTITPLGRSDVELVPGEEKGGVSTERT